MDFEDDFSSECDSEEDLGFQKKALVVEIPENFDPNKIPQNGEEYLQHVMYEAKRCKQLVVVPIDKNKVKAPMQIQVREECKKAPTSFLPTLHWQEATILDFVKFRKYIAEKQISWPKSTKDLNVKKCLNESAPTLSIIATLSLEDKIKAIETISKYLSETNPGESINDLHAMWAYSLLSTLEIPLFPDTCHCLRELARACSQVRSKLLPHKESESVPLNLIICIIARFFRQLDLADN